jgi:tetratricopeptide (TPR) repeat protein
VRWMIAAGICLLAAAGSALLALAAGLELPAMVAVAGAGGVLGLLAPLGWQAYVDRGEARARREAVFAPLEAPPEGVNRDSSPAGWLSPQLRVAPFHGRTRELSALAAWCADTDGSPVRLMVAPGGTGKTRLALRLGEQLRTGGWYWGVLKKGQAADAVPTAIACRQAALIVVDEAETLADLGTLLEAVAAHGGRPAVRVLLVTRSIGGDWDGWWERLRTERYMMGKLASTQVLELRQLVNNDAFRKDLFSEAVAKFAQVKEIPAPRVELESTDSESILLLQAAALVAVLRAARGDSQPVKLRLGYDVLPELLDREQDYWEKTAQRLAISPPTRTAARHAVALVSLFGATDRDAAISLLRQVPELADSTGERLGQLADWLHVLYPASGAMWAGQPQPHLLTETLAVIAFSDARIRALVGSGDADDKQLQSVLSVLASSSRWRPDAETTLASLIAENPGRWAVAAIGIIPQQREHSVIDGALSRALTVNPPTYSVFIDLSERLEDISENILLRTRIAIVENLVIHARERASEPEDLTDQLMKLGELYFRSGRLGQALSALHEVVGLLRPLAEDGPEYQADLAMALNDIGATLRDLGKYEQALEPLREAVGLLRSLAEDNPEYLTDLTGLLNNLGGTLRRLGKHKEALEPLREAVGLLRPLAEDDPDDRPALAGIFVTLGLILREVGSYEEALERLREAIGLLGPLAEGNPASQRDLGAAQMNLGITLRDLGKPGQAQEPLREAVGLLRPLAEDNPAHRPELALALINIGATLEELGRHEEALEPLREAVGLLRPLAEDNPAHQPALAMTLINIGVTLRSLGRHEEALEPLREAVGLLRPLAEDNPAHQPALAIALVDVGATQLSRGSSGQALESLQEAVGLLRPLAEDNPAHQPALAMALTDVGAAFRRLGQNSEAIDPWAEAHSIYVELAQQYPDGYSRRLVLTRRLLRELLMGLGRGDEAIQLGLYQSPQNVD